MTDPFRDAETTPASIPKPQASSMLVNVSSSVAGNLASQLGGDFRVGFERTAQVALQQSRQIQTQLHMQISVEPQLLSQFRHLFRARAFSQHHLRRIPLERNGSSETPGPQCPAAWGPAEAAVSGRRRPWRASPRVDQDRAVFRGFRRPLQSACPIRTCWNHLLPVGCRVKPVTVFLNAAVWAACTRGAQGASWNTISCAFR